MNEELINQQIKTVLSEAIQILFPVSVDPVTLIKRHVWRNRNYVGEYNNRVVVWKGWSANLVSVDFRYRVIFVDVVDNVLPYQEKVRLFGPDFAAKINNFDKFVVLYVTDFPLNTVEDIKKQGFIPRRTPKALHACVILEIEEFINMPALYWAAKITKLVLLQKFLSTHRRPYAANEVPFQHLLYSTGFFHSYIVKGGLHLYELSKPRKAGEFGHDFHAIVGNPLLPNPAPFPIGIEIYNGSLGYHIDTIPQYINRFHLRGLIVVAKDNPFRNIDGFVANTTTSVFFAKNLKEIGTNQAVGIHYLSLATIIVELSNIRDELETLVATVPFLK